MRNQQCILSSTDGVNWTYRPCDADYGSSPMQDVAWNGSMFVAIYHGKDAPRIYSSSDGVSWTTRSTNLEPLNWLFSAIAWSPTLGLWVTVSNTNPEIYFSSDATTWTLAANSGSAPSNPFGQGWVNDVCWTGAKFVAVGSNGFSGNTAPPVASSTDGNNWSYTTPGGGTGMENHQIGAVSSYNGYVVAPFGAQLAYTNNFSTWTLTGVPASTQDLYTQTRAAWSGSLWAIGGSPNTSATTTLATSPNLVNWTDRPNPLDQGSNFNGNINDVHYGGGKFVVVGQDDNLVHIMTTSPDGVTWTVQPTPWDGQAGQRSNGYISHLTYANGTWVAVGQYVPGTGGTGGTGTAPGWQMGAMSL